MRGGSASSADEKAAQGGTRASAEEIHDNVLKDARKELEKPAAALGWSALARLPSARSRFSTRCSRVGSVAHLGPDR